ncbi:MAG: hypothetical protein GX434_18650 [Peptococcaceae bacterium]|nr:hypothetical protein [Peptococcaceae bacterium]
MVRRKIITKVQVIRLGKIVYGGNIMETAMRLGSKKEYEIRFNALRKAFEKYRDLPEDRPLKAIIDTNIEIYRISCKNSLHDEKKRRFETLMIRYILPEENKRIGKEISLQQYVCLTTVWRDTQAALKDLMVIFFGIDGILFEDM